MKSLLIIFPTLLYCFINKHLRKEYGLSKEKDRLILYISIPIYIIFAYLYKFNFTTLIYSLSLSIVFSISALDMEKHIIPNKLIVILLGLGMTNLLLNIYMYKLLISGLLLTFVFGTILYFITKGSIGGGDIKFLSALGFIVGYYNIYIIVFISFSIAALYGILRVVFKKDSAKTSIPFGPFIAFGFLVVNFI